MHLWYQFDNPRRLPSCGIASTRFSEDLTSDLNRVTRNPISLLRLSDKRNVSSTCTTEAPDSDSSNWEVKYTYYFPFAIQNYSPTGKDPLWPFGEWGTYIVKWGGHRIGATQVYHLNLLKAWRVTEF